MIDDGGMMFPKACNPEQYAEEPGCSYRWWLAGMAMHALISCDATIEDDDKKLARNSVFYADALIARLRATDQKGGGE